MLTACLPFFLESSGFCTAGEECKMATGEGGGWQCPQPFWWNVALVPFPRILQRRVRRQICQVISSGMEFVFKVNQQIRQQDYNFANRWGLSMQYQWAQINPHLNLSLFANLPRVQDHCKWRAVTKATNTISLITCIHPAIATQPWDPWEAKFIP